MNAEFGNLVLEQLRGIRREIADFRREIRTDPGHLRPPVSSMERHLANLGGDVALVHRRLDRIERRLELTDAPA